MCVCSGPWVPRVQCLPPESASATARATDGFSAMQSTLLSGPSSAPTSSRRPSMLCGVHPASHGVERDRRPSKVWLGDDNQRTTLT